jgi:predicted fused transcriptional regulator/phosphomethylpyrimidine kinase
MSFDVLNIMYEPLKIEKCKKCGKVISETERTNQNSEG